MRLVYLNADRGIPLLGSKGASVHVRASLRAFAPRLERLTAVSARLEPKSGPVADPSGVPARLVGPFGGGGGVEGALRANDEAAICLEKLYEAGDLEVLYERLSLWSVAGAETARRFALPWFLELNAPLAEEACAYRDLEGRQLAFFLQHSRLRECTGLVVVSEELRRWAMESGVDSDRILVAPNGCDLPGDDRADNDTTDRAFTVVFVGSLKPWHGLDTLVEAFIAFHAVTPGSRLVIVGDGPEYDRVRDRLAAALPADAFRMTGAVPHEEVPEHLRHADVAVAPYPELPDFYFSPLKVMEYCAAGLPIVASRIGQIADTLTDGENALLVEPGHAPALADALRLLRRDVEQRAHLGRGARHLAEGRSWHAVTDRILQWMQSRILTTTPELAEVAR